VPVAERTDEQEAAAEQAAVDAAETRDWLDALRDLHALRGADRVRAVLRDLQIEAQRRGIPLPVTAQTPYVNTIPPEREPAYPGSIALERRIKSLVRWNAMAMVVQANRVAEGIGGHISTYASAATLYEVGFNHYFRGPDHPSGGDLLYIQGHASPGIYARAYLEGRLDATHLHGFRREVSMPGGMPSYPHPWLWPDFWQFPTVSMGLGPILAIYQARFMEYLHDRGLLPRTGRKVWAFLGDGETDEPEALGAISLAAREQLDHLVFVVNCNLQRLDGPVRGNGQIVQELEAIFRGAGWNVIKVLWGTEWDELLARDTDGLLVRRMGAIPDGEYQKYVVAGGAYIREHFWGADPRLAAMVQHLDDDQLWRLTVGGHDPRKVHAAYHAAMVHEGSPTVILARTIKGYGLGEAGEGRNVTHQQKKLNTDELLHFRDRFDIPLGDDEVAEAPLFRPPPESAERRYLAERRGALGGSLPARRVPDLRPRLPGDDLYREFFDGTGERESATTMAFVRLLGRLMRSEEIGRLIVPIVPDEARTFGMEALFRQAGIYAHQGQLYEPVDADTLLFYKESRDGQILEEGITEAGAMSSFVAAGTAFSTHGVPTIPFFIFYSMFGMQRVGDLVWAAGDARTRGFLLGATAGRTTLAGEGLQHDDGHSLVLSSVYPHVVSYDPAYAYEIAVIVREGLRRMYGEQEDVIFYLTLENELYPHPPLPDGAEEGILRGMHRVQAAPPGEGPLVQLLGSGALLRIALAAAAQLRGYGVRADVWSVTSYTELRREALAVERRNRLHPEREPERPYVARAIAEAVAEPAGPCIAVSDYMTALPDSIARWLPGPLWSLGTDGFGRSDTRAALRGFFEVDERSVVVCALYALQREGVVAAEVVAAAIAELGIDPAAPDPATR